MSYRSHKTVAGTHVSSIFTAAEPTGAAENDVLIMQYFDESEGGTHDFTAPTGWTQLAAVDADGSANVRFSGRVFAIRRGSSAPSYGVTGVNTSSPGFYIEATVSAWSGIDTAIAMSSLVVADTGNQSSNPSNPDSPSVTTTVDGSVVVSAGFTWGGVNTTWTPPSSYTIGEDGSSLGNGSANAFAYRTITSHGAENPGAFAGAITGVDPWWGVSIVLPPAAGGGGATAKTVSGVADASVKTLDGVAKASVKSIVGLAP